MAKRQAAIWFRRGNWWRRLRHNRRYKDALFRQLFREKQDLLDLYNALNGSGMQTDNMMLYLSDSFPAGRGSGCLECSCEVLNINRGYNQALMEKCHRLWEYSEFSSEIEENIKRGMRREEAIHTAIDTCIEKGILTDILKKQKAEVLHMILTEYDEKKHFRTLFREGKEKGREELLREQIQKKLAKGKTVPEIAEELEEEISVIERIINTPVSDNPMFDYLD